MEFVDIVHGRYICMDKCLFLILSINYNAMLGCQIEFRCVISLFIEFVDEKLWMRVMPDECFLIKSKWSWLFIVIVWMLFFNNLFTMWTLSYTSGKSSSYPLTCHRLNAGRMAIVVICLCRPVHQSCQILKTIWVVGLVAKGQESG